jgi:hypothetical protein
MATPELSYLTSRFQDWYAWCDNGTETIFYLDARGKGSELSGIFTLTISSIMVVIAIPKYLVSVDMLHAALETKVQVDEAQDLIGINQDDEHGNIRWGMLLIDAVKLVDPVTAESILLTDIAKQN